MIVLAGRGFDDVRRELVLSIEGYLEIRDCAAAV